MDTAHLRAKTCTKCGEVKMLTEFVKAKNGKGGLAARCKSCDAIKRAKWYADNPTYNAEYFEKNKDVQADYRKNYWATRSPEVRERRQVYLDKNKDEAVIRVARWRGDNPAKARALSSNRRANKLKATATWADKIKILQMYCDAELLSNSTECAYHVDHIIPLKNPLVCGLHVENNLQVITAAENMSKHNKFIPGPYYPEGNIHFIYLLKPSSCLPTPTPNPDLPGDHM